MKNKTVLLTGITGQAGVAFTKKFLETGHVVVGLYRRTANDAFGKLEEEGVLNNENLILESGDVTDLSSLDRAIVKHRPTIIGNLAANSHVGESFHNPVANLRITGEGCTNVLEAIRNNMGPDYRPKFWQMSSSEMFGGNFSDPYGGHFNVEDCQPSLSCFQDENTPMSANSPYAAAKIYAHNMTELYRKAYGIYANSIINFNFEGPYRGETFVTRKITKWVAQFAQWRRQYQEYPIMYTKDSIMVTDQYSKVISTFSKLRLGNIDSMRDWTYVEDMVNAVLFSLKEDAPNTYCVCSNNTFSVKYFLIEAFKQIGIEDWNSYIVIDSKFYRPCEVPFLCGRSNKIRRLGWAPTVPFQTLVRLMVDIDVKRNS